MDTTTFARTYLQNESTIIRILRRLGIYDDDLLHDTYIALFQHSQHTAINDFTKMFISFYRVRHKRRGEHESHYMACDNATMEETYNCWDETDLEHREQVAARVDAMIEKLKARPLPGERNRKLAIKIISLYRKGLTFAEIAKKLKTSPQAVQQQLSRTIEKIRASY